MRPGFEKGALDLNPANPMVGALRRAGRWQSGRPLLAAGLACLLVRSAAAHESGDLAGGFLSGAAHPLWGLDHVAAMVAVGLWGGQLKQPAMWLLPLTFPLVMACGGVLGARGVPLPGVELGIALSAIALGLLVAGQVRPPLGVAAALVGLFAIFHGHAHGTELPEAATPLAYGAGFVLATGGLHAAGICVGLLADHPRGTWVVRLGGVVVALVGGYFLLLGLGP